MESFERLHTLLCAAAPLGQQTAMKLLEKFKNPDFIVQQGDFSNSTQFEFYEDVESILKFVFRTGYGLTETSPGVMQTPLNNEHLGSCGRLISRTQAKIVDLETGDNLGPNQHGELFLRGPQIMKGYLNNPEATREMIGEDGWLRTGDVAYYDDGANFYFVDRLKELIKVKGFQVMP